MGEFMHVFAEALQMEGKIIEHREHSGHPTVPYSRQLKPGFPPYAFTATSESYPSSEIYTNHLRIPTLIDRS